MTAFLSVLKIIASNDSHYVDQDDFYAHDILLCINTGEKIATPALRDFNDDDIHVKDKRFAFPNDQFYFKSTDEMKKLFSDVPEAIDNTNLIVDRVELLNLKKDILLPAFPIPKEFQVHGDSNLNQWEFLRHLTYEGARNRYNDLTPAIQERLDFELFTIKTMPFLALWAWAIICTSWASSPRSASIKITQTSALSNAFRERKTE